MGCEMSVSVNSGGGVEVNGCACKLGKEYAKDELLNPRRIVTSTVKVRNGCRSLVPVWTTGSVLKDRVLDIMKELERVEIEAPVKVHQIIVKNICNLGVDIESSGNVVGRDVEYPQTGLDKLSVGIGYSENFLMDALQKKMVERINNSVNQADTTKKVIIGSKVISQTACVFAELFGDKPVIIVADKNTYLAAGKAVMEAFISSGKKNISRPLIIEDNDLYAEYRFVERVTKHLGSVDAIPVAVGSGTINDLVKLSAHNCKRPYMVVATAGSMDGYTAFGASITKGGFKQTMSCSAPIAVVADIDVIENAPAGMNSSGYADLIAKIPAGADWLVADALGIEPIDQKAWQLIQPHLREWVSNPAGIKNKDRKSLMMLMEGLIMSGLAMQASQSSRPASGADHQFSHLWDNEHLVYNGKSPSHGFKVGIGSICSESLYEKLLTLKLEDVETDSEIIKKWWPQWKTVETIITGYFKESFLAEQVIQQSRAKYIDAGKLSERLKLLRSIWPQLKSKLEEQLLGAKKIQDMIKAAGSPSLPEGIGVSYDKLHSSFKYAQLIRRRYTVLDIAIETGLWSKCVDSLFAKNGFWGFEQKVMPVGIRDLTAAYQKA
jgi:glycerol-1-phosphate dehydrogenase [NAD(P)+]